MTGDKENDRGDRSSQSWWSRQTEGRKNACIGALAVLLAAVVSGSFVVLGAGGSPPTSAPAPTPTTPTSTRSPLAACDSLSATPQVHRGPGAAAAPTISVASASYDLTPGPQMQIRIAGQIGGRPPAGQGIYLARNASTEAGSRDSTASHYLGSAYFFLNPMPIDLDAAGCWSYIAPRLAYRCAAGIDFNYYFLLMFDADAQRLVQRASSNPVIKRDGLPDSEILNAPGIHALAWFNVPTDPLEDCH